MADGGGRHQSCARGPGTEKIVHKKLKRLKTRLEDRGWLMGVGRHQSCARGPGTEKIVHKKLKKTQNSVGRQGG